MKLKKRILAGGMLASLLVSTSGSMAADFYDPAPGPGATIYNDHHVINNTEVNNTTQNIYNQWPSRPRPRVVYEEIKESHSERHTVREFE